MRTGDKKRIVILDGGFGWVTTAQRLQKHFKKSPEAEITLVNRENFFVFIPMLATSAAVRSRSAGATCSAAEL